MGKQVDRWRHACGLVFVVVVAATAVRAAPEKSTDASQQASAERMRRMREQAESVALEYKRQPIGLLAAPLLRFDGADASCSDGAIWAADNSRTPGVSRGPGAVPRFLVARTSLVDLRAVDGQVGHNGTPLVASCHRLRNQAVARRTRSGRHSPASLASNAGNRPAFRL